MKYIIAPILGLTALVFIGTTQAATYNFACLTNNSGDCNSIASLLTLDVTNPNAGETLFQFNVAAIGGNVAVKEIYFDDDALGLLNSATADVDETGGTVAGGGVDFQSLDVPGENFPSGGSFVETFSIEAEPPSGDNQHGIDNGESLGILFKDTDFASILLALGGDLGIGLHAGSLGAGNQYSESLILTPSPVPVPAAFWLFGTALIGFIGISRRTKI